MITDFFPPPVDDRTVLIGIRVTIAAAIFAPGRFVGILFRAGPRRFVAGCVLRFKNRSG